MLHRGTQEMFNYWNVIRQERPAPLRSDIEPASIAGVLSSTFILQPGDNGAFVFRLAGTQLCQLFDHELKQVEFAKLVDSDDRSLLKRAIAAVVEESVCVVTHIDATFSNGETISMELLLLPLSDRSPRIIGTLQALERPYWLDSETIVSAKMKNLRVMDADVSLFSLQNRPAIELPNVAANDEIGTFDVFKRFNLIQGGNTGRAAKTATPAAKQIFRVFSGGLSEQKH